MPVTDGAPSRSPAEWITRYEAAADFLRATEIGPAEPERLAEVRQQIAMTGTYHHTCDELWMGAQWAWRNADRCIGRLHWQSLRLLDRRDCTTADDVAAACIEHIRVSTNGGNLRPAITVFAPSDPDDGSGIRIWNSQLIRYAGIRQPDGSILGDPLNIGLTDLAMGLGWRPKGGQFDLLPLIVQMPHERPRLFDLPRDVVLEVDIEHPDLRWFAELGLRWHALPAISDMALEMGGLAYPAAPFSGWYMSTEIAARNFGDEHRYNLLPEIAARMGLDTSSTRTLWKDRALLELCAAVSHSFRESGVRMVDHHQASRQFVKHVEREAAAGRTCPTDWSWIVPPVSGSTTAVFHRYYDAPESARGPRLVHQPGPGPDLAFGSDQLDGMAAMCPVAH